jgi:hypothetical protein
MERRHSNILFTFLATVSCFLAVVYTSCSKTADNIASCDGINCQNGGVCRIGKCVCPYGYEGVNCEINYHDKYLGGWNVHETIVGSNVSTAGLHKDSLYTVIIASSSTSTTGLTSPTSFFIQRMLGDANFINLASVVDTMSSSSFYFEPNQSIGAGKLIIYSGKGSIDVNHTTITGSYVRNRLGAATVIYDSLTFVMSKQ